MEQHILQPLPRWQQKQQSPSHHGDPTQGEMQVREGVEEEHADDKKEGEEGFE